MSSSPRSDLLESLEVCLDVDLESALDLGRSFLKLRESLELLEDLLGEILEFLELLEEPLLGESLYLEDPR